MPPEERVEALRTTLLLREFEDRIADRHAAGEILGLVHLSQSLETVTICACGALEADDSVFRVGQAEEVGGSFDLTAGLYKEWGHGRVRNTPISEAAQTSAGIGTAATGLWPVLNPSFADFGVYFDQLVN
jgi:Pyruvate/2-oxoglutarate dehydrogenase complex, dehydrogenase (E1) component, eukaryotic type, beta subunit